MKNKLTIIFLFLSISFNGVCSDFNPFFWHVLKVEGRSFVETAFDRGGATMLGITFKTFLSYCGKPAVPINCDKNNDKRLTAADMFSLRPVDVLPIYKRDYWDVIKADSIHNQAIAEFMADFVVNSGGSKPRIQQLQKVVGAFPDGKFGVKTLAKINGQNPQTLFNKLYRFRTNYYYSLAQKDHTQRKFLKGWLRRIFNLKSIYKNEGFI
jgi:lysozyme family protein